MQCEHLVVVSNEVFSGGANYAGDTDRYLKALAQVNNALAARADAVVRVVCGIPVYRQCSAQAPQGPAHCADERERAHRVAHVLFVPVELRHRDGRKHGKGHCNPTKRF